MPRNLLAPSQQVRATILFTMWPLAQLQLLLVAAVWGRDTWPLAHLPITTGGSAKKAVLLTQFGGVADGVTDNSPAFAKAFSHLRGVGGGTLVVPRSSTGTETVYASLPIALANMASVTLRVEAGVRIVAKCDTVVSGGWRIMPGFEDDGIDGGTQYAPLLHATNVTDLSIEGQGTFDGNGSWWYAAEHAKTVLHSQRPRLFIIEDCRRVALSNFTTHNSAYWNLVVYRTDDVHISGVVVRNPTGGSGSCGGAYPAGDCFGANADGLDLVSVCRCCVCVCVCV